MIETGIAIVDALLEKPVESVIIIGMIVFTYKYWFGSEYKRGMLWLNVKHTVTMFVKFDLPRIVNNRRYSYCGLDIDDLNECFRIIGMLNGVHNWEQRRLLEVCLMKNDDEVAQLIHALVDMGKIDWDENHCLVPTNHMKQDKDNEKEVIQ